MVLKKATITIWFNLMGLKARRLCHILLSVLRITQICKDSGYPYSIAFNGPVFLLDLSCYEIKLLKYNALNYFII